MKNRILTFFFLLMLSVSIQADVFTLGPFRGGKSWGADILGGAKLWTEKMKVNGINTGMRLTLLDKNLVECLKIMKNQFPKAVFRFNKESLLVEIKREKGIIERIYLVNIGGVYPVIQFSMEIPENFHKEPKWPEELPIAPASFPKTVIELTDRGTVYGTYSSSLSPRRVINDADSTMTSKGWQPIGKGLYLKNDPMRIVIVTAVEDENGKTHCSVIKRKLKTK